MGFSWNLNSAQLAARAWESVDWTFDHAWKEKWTPFPDGVRSTPAGRWCQTSQGSELEGLYDGSLCSEGCGFQDNQQSLHFLAGRCLSANCLCAPATGLLRHQRSSWKGDGCPICDWWPWQIDSQDSQWPGKRRNWVKQNGSRIRSLEPSSHFPLCSRHPLMDGTLAPGRAAD